MKPSPEQIVDAVRAMEIGGSMIFATAEEVDRFGGPVARASTRYAELKRQMSLEEAGAVSKAEMVGEILGVETTGILEEALRRFDLHYGTPFDQTRLERKRATERGVT